MKRLITICFVALLSITAFAQKKDVTKFLGIPVDGYKSEMRQKLIAKGFTPKTRNGEEFFEGEFNGSDVELYIVTHNNKVWRILVADKYFSNETDIKIRFNKLCSQFKYSKNYVYRSIDQTIPEDEDISYGIIKNKRYEASFQQIAEELDSAEYEKKFDEYISRLFTKEEWEKELQEDPNGEETWRKIFESSRIGRKPVWFMIKEYSYDKYGILLFYDNEYNQANGEDL